MQDFVNDVRHKRPMERAAKIRAFLKEDGGLPGIRELVRSQWDPACGMFSTEYGDADDNAYVYDALERINKWQAKLEERAKADEESGEDGGDWVSPAPVNTSDAQQPTPSQDTTTPSASDTSSDTISLPQTGNTTNIPSNDDAISEASTDRTISVSPEEIHKP